MALYAFDGTWNTDSSDDIEDTNVVAFRDLYMGNACYVEGVGTRSGTVGRVLGGLFGFGGHSRIDEMTQSLIENWEEDDRVVDVVGFSRGAALAVHFTNQLAKEGITLFSGEIVKPEIRFLGLWDIVASFGLSFDTLVNFNEINLGWDIDQVSTNVKHCFHAMALDERRETFRITRLNEKGDLQNINEVWFRGVHSDVGGGNRNRERSNIALQWMLDKAVESGVHIHKNKRHQPLYVEMNQFSKVSENQDVKVDPRRKVLAGDQIHPTAEPITLSTGDTHKALVHSSLRFNWSGVRLEKGKSYRVATDPDAKCRTRELSAMPMAGSQRI